MLEWIAETGIIWVCSNGAVGLIELLDLASRSKSVSSCGVFDGTRADVWLFNSVQAEKFTRSAVTAFDTCYVGACLMILCFEKLHLKIVFSALSLWSDDGLSIILFFISPARTKSTTRTVTLDLRVVRLLGIHDDIIFIKNKRRFPLYNTIANVVESWVIYRSFIRWRIAWSRQSFHFLLLVSGDWWSETCFFLE